MRTLGLVIAVGACSAPSTPRLDPTVRVQPAAASTAASLDSRYLRHGGRAFDLASVPGAPVLVSLGADDRIDVWRTDTATLEQSIETPEQMTALAVSPDGAWIAAAGSEQLVVFSATTGAVRWKRDWRYYKPRRLAFVADGTRLFVAADNGIPRAAFLGFLDAATGSDGHVFTGSLDAYEPDQLATVFSDAAVTRSGTWVAVSMKDGPVTVWHADGTRRELAIDHPGPLAFTSDDAWLVADGYDDVAWRTADWAPHAIDLGAVGIGVALLPVDGTADLVAIDTTRVATVTPPAFEPRLVHAIESEYSAPAAVHGAAVAIWRREGIVLWNRATGDRITPPRVHAGPVRAVDVSPRGDLAITGEEGALHVWALPGGTRRATFPLKDHDDRPAEVKHARFAADGSWALIAASHRLLRLDLTGAPDLEPLADLGDQIVAAALDPAGARYAAIVYDGSDRGQQLVIGAPGTAPRTIDRWTIYEGDTECLDFVGDDRVVHAVRNANAAFGDGAVTIYNLVTGGKDRVANAMHGDPCSMSRAGVLATVQSDDPGYSATTAATYVELVRLADKQAVGRFPVRLTGATLRFSSDGTRLAAAARAYRPLGVAIIREESAQPDRVHILDGATAAEITTIRGHAGTIYDVAFSPDGTTLFGASEDGTVHIWPIPAR